jgi:hypothetical protein
MDLQRTLAHSAFDPTTMPSGKPISKPVSMPTPTSNPITVPKSTMAPLPTSNPTFVSKMDLSISIPNLVSTPMATSVSSTEPCLEPNEDPTTKPHSNSSAKPIGESIPAEIMASEFECTPHWSQNPSFNPAPDPLYHSPFNTPNGGVNDIIEVWEDYNGKDILIDQISVVWSKDLAHHQDQYWDTHLACPWDPGEGNVPVLANHQDQDWEPLVICPWKKLQQFHLWIFMDHYKDVLWVSHKFVACSPRMVCCLDPYWELALLYLTIHFIPPIHLAMRKGECTQASVTSSHHGLPLLDALIGGEEGSPPISPITLSLGSSLGGKEGSPGNLSNHHINLVMVHCDFDVTKVNNINVVSPGSIFPRATYLDSSWVSMCCCFPLSGCEKSMTSYWCLPNGPHARIIRACLRSTMVQYLGQDWDPLCKDFQWIYTDHYKDHSPGKLQQPTLPVGILQWESGESENGEEVTGEQYLFNALLNFKPTIIPIAMPRENGEHIHANGTQKPTIIPIAMPSGNGEQIHPKGRQISRAFITIHNGATWIIDPTHPPSGVSMHKAPTRVWDPGGSALY